MNEPSKLRLNNGSKYLKSKEYLIAMVREEIA